jgi:hypothetical protein
VRTTLTVATVILAYPFPIGSSRECGSGESFAVFAVIYREFTAAGSSQPRKSLGLSKWLSKKQQDGRLFLSGTAGIV